MKDAQAAGNLKSEVDAASVGNVQMSELSDEQLSAIAGGVTALRMEPVATKPLVAKQLPVGSAALLAKQF